MLQWGTWILLLWEIKLKLFPAKLLINWNFFLTLLICTVVYCPQAVVSDNIRPYWWDVTMLQIRISRQRNDMETMASDASLKQLLSLMRFFFASPSSLTLKTNQRSENAIFATAVHKVSDPLLLLISFQPLLLFIYVFKINVSTQFLFARRLSVISFLSAACVLHTVLYLPFKISLFCVEF